MFVRFLKFTDIEISIPKVVLLQTYEDKNGLINISVKTTNGVDMVLPFKIEVEIKNVSKDIDSLIVTFDEDSIKILLGEIAWNVPKGTNSKVVCPYII